MTRSIVGLLAAMLSPLAMGLNSWPALAEEGVMARAVENLSVARPTWHRGAGLLYGEVTVKNRNTFSVVNVIISCDLFDEWGNPLGSKGTVLRAPMPPGKTRVSGIEFAITTRNMQAGACRAVSAERL